MEHIRVSKVERVRLRRGGSSTEYVGTLNLTTHHLIFSAGELKLWIGYALIHSAELIRPPRLTRKRENINSYGTEQQRQRSSSAELRVYSEEELAEWALEGAIRIRCHHFLFVTLRCEDVRRLYDIFATVKHLACVRTLRQLYAFEYDDQFETNGWEIYDARAEFERMGVGSTEGGRFWRITQVNRGFGLCATYPPLLAVPAKISDTTLTYAARYRSKGRLPVLCYLHPNRASITRASQPMVGLKQARSVQDEKLVEAILASSEPQGTPPRYDYQRNNIIIDARPTTNAVVNRAVGAGSENMDHYKRCRKAYLGIDNIHVMRDALNKLVAAIQYDEGEDAVGVDDESDVTPERGVVARIQSSRSNWLKHIENIMVGVSTIVEAIDAGHHVVVHCSDGWDRTAQLTSLAQLCLDPYYRTIHGFAVLVEKEWVSFGHQFTLRCGHKGHPDRFKITRASKRKQHQSGAQDTVEDGLEETEIVKVEEKDVGTSNANGGSSTSGLDDGPGFDALLQSGTSMFGRFASRAFRGVQSRISSAIQAASDNMEDENEQDPFFVEYPELQPNYVPPSSSNPIDGGSLSGHERKTGGGFRLGGRSKHDHETSPVFQQFLDCVYQLWVQHPTAFEFNERFLLDLFYHLHTAQFGTFLANNMKERQELDMRNSTKSVWSWVCQKLDKEGDGDGIYYNTLYGRGSEERRQTQQKLKRTILPDTRFIRYWSAMFSCHDPAFTCLQDTGAVVVPDGLTITTDGRCSSKSEDDCAAVPAADDQSSTVKLADNTDISTHSTDPKASLHDKELVSKISDLSFCNVWES
ncbi:phosphatases II [Coemansia reversa NRRL 1564]|uniref:Phosphatases II n=1 Tax=Coemansia reversa (strain ATCC 12441 / NRRL 1564) TaxID=763665 RepID=A0A2G5B9R4_COERN|nr:phosphatases II [Coemansia reversa NRRL 1564]|eukprot:PIA15751.1 phosphatases II [Coemansia reversa NRRL 1564]